MNFKLRNTRVPDPNFPQFNGDQIQSFPLSTSALINDDFLLFNTDQWTFTTILNDLLYDNPYSAVLYYSGDNTILSGISTQLLFDTTRWDTSGTMADLENDQVIIRQAGKYLLRTTATVPLNVSGTIRQLTIKRNTTDVTQSFNYVFNSTIPLHSMAVIECEEDDVIQVFGEQDSGGSLAMGTSSGIESFTTLYVIYMGN
jgi:hypothetical protein